MEIQLLSKSYKVSRMEGKDVPAILHLCERNPQYYQYAPPFVSAASIREDMKALPPGKGMEDKYYLGIRDHRELAAVMDLIAGYPDADTAWIGFFMMNAGLQRKGIGTKIIGEACFFLKKYFTSVQLGYVRGNRQSEGFWIKNGFEPTGVIKRSGNREIVVMQRTLQV